jgi:hypothetical protein
MERVENRILSIRGHRVMLDADLAEIYGVPTKRLNEAVRRNAARFPEDFMFQLKPDEAETLRSQFATSNGRGDVGIFRTPLQSWAWRCSPPF